MYEVMRKGVEFCLERGGVRGRTVVSVVYRIERGKG